MVEGGQASLQDGNPSHKKLSSQKDLKLNQTMPPKAEIPSQLTKERKA